MSDTKPGGKLPRTRKRDVPKPGPDEKVRWSSGADLQNGWWSRHGTLSATDERLVFIPTILDGVLGGHRHQIPLEDIRELERWPESPGAIPPGGRRPRLLVHTPTCVYQIIVGDLDAWLDALEKVYVLRAKRGLTHRPTFRREESDNFLLAEE